MTGEIVFLRNLPCFICKQTRDVAMINGLNLCAYCIENLWTALKQYHDESVRVKALTPDPPPV